MTSASELRDAFAKFDANGDGVLSFDELVGVFTRPVDDGEPMTEEQARAYVAKHDKNGDGKLDPAEFKNAYNRWRPRPRHSIRTCIPP